MNFGVINTNEAAESTGGVWKCDDDSPLRRHSPVGHPPLAPFVHARGMAAATGASRAVAAFLAL